ncbi:hypothetical protein A2U01_0051721, partial [Trifolium medium]|nr:hypothetical protein [Trifolium medium]
KQKKRKRTVKVKLEKVVEEKTSGNTSASGARAPEAKPTEEKKATETAAAGDVEASETKVTNKGKSAEVTASEVKPVAEKKGKSVKKPRTIKKRAARIQRKNVVSDSEETEEEESMFKRKRTKHAQEEAIPKKA